mgnify:CR=1 FL=1
MTTSWAVVVNSWHRAGVLEWVDRRGSGPRARKSVEVRVLSPARSHRSHAPNVVGRPYIRAVTHPASHVHKSLALHARGLSARAIADRLDIPRRTISDWVSGRLPRFSALKGNGCTACQGPAPHRFEELPPAYVYLLGLYLGDGSIATHARGVYKLRLTLDAAYPRIIDEATTTMTQVLPQSRVNTWPRPYGDVEVYSYSKAWPCFFPQHGSGKKHLRPIRLSGWQERLVRRAPHLLLRGLIHSDGCRFLNTGRGWSHPRYAFSNLSPDIRGIFMTACDLLGLRWTTSGRTVYVSRKDDVQIMDRFIGPKA